MLSQRAHYVAHFVMLVILIFMAHLQIPHSHLPEPHMQPDQLQVRQDPIKSQCTTAPCICPQTTSCPSASSSSSSSSSSSCPTLPPPPSCAPCKTDAIPPPQCESSTTVVPNSLGTLVTNNDADALLTLINQAPVRNSAKFTLEPDFVPLVMRVHREEIALFRKTIHYFSLVNEINKTMLIISFDALISELLAEAMKIDFCQVKILLAPSGHWMQNRVPGPQPGLPDVRDQYGNPRPWLHAAIKHHFWWHTVQVWEHTAELRDVQGDMCFSEADHWPVPDYYQVAKALALERKHSCPSCFGNNLGGTPFLDIPTAPKDGYTTYTHGYRGNMGMCYPRSTWELMKGKAYEFCHHDDYNWDETLLSLALAHKIPIASLIPDVPRLVHVTHCGFHTKKEQCSDPELTSKLSGNFEAQMLAKWPSLDYTVAKWEHYKPRDKIPQGPPFKGWGGWAHPADIEFCMKLVSEGEKKRWSFW